MTVAFTPALLNSHLALKDFFSGEKQIQEIAQKKPMPSTWRYSTIWLAVTAPLALIYALFLKALSLVAYYLGFTNFSKICSLKAQHQYEPLASRFMGWGVRNDILVPATNSQQLDTSDIYLQKEIPVESLTDPLVYGATAYASQKAISFEKIKKYDERCENAFKEALATPEILKLSPEKRHEFFSPLREKYAEERNLLLKKIEVVLANHQNLEFFHDGSCNGMSLWFINLYLKTGQLFQDRVQHLKAISQYFIHGAPREASLLQTIYSGEDFAGLQNITSLHRVAERTLEIENIDSPKIKETVSDLPVGVYQVSAISPKIGHSLVGHALALIKIGRHSSFLFDPAHGLIKCEGEAGYSNIESLLKNHKKSDAPLEISFNQIELM